MDESERRPGAPSSGGAPRLNKVIRGDAANSASSAEAPQFEKPALRSPPPPGVVRAQESMFGVPLLGLPAVSVPTAPVDGLPMGVQIIGQRFREDMVLDAAQVIEARCAPATPIDPRF